MGGPLLLLVAGLGLAGGDAEAAVRRFAVLVGNNVGAPSMHTLYFAEDDALKMHDILTSVAGYDAADVEVVLGGTRDDVMRALVGVRGDVALARNQGHETLFLFYYSGHADAQRLQLGRTWLTWPTLEDLVELTGADVRLAFVDACQSGAMTGTKGGTMAPSFVFDLSERLGATGQVIITSSSRDEASQESDEIGGSYFTHYLASALLGAADEDADDRVTLAEAYRYVYHETVFRTSTTRAGTQHPTYEWELAGKGDVVLADLGAARSTLVFPSTTAGLYAVFDQNRRTFVAEVEVGSGGQRLALRPGTYLLQRRHPTHLSVARVDLADGLTFDVSQARFQAVEYEDDIARGAVDDRIHKANLPRTAVRLLFGTRRFSEAEVAASYVPTHPVGGAGVRFYWRDGRWAGADLTSGALASTLTFDDLEYEVPVVASSVLGGGWAGYATRPRTLQAGAGLGLQAAYFRRDFPSLDLPAQDLFSVAPGFVGWLGLHPGRVELDLELRLQYLPWRLDGRAAGLGFSDAFLTFGYRF